MLKVTGVMTTNRGGIIVSEKHRRWDSLMTIGANSQSRLENSSTKAKTETKLDDQIA
jgi:hypothetical protein